jgi:hypothetical protein
MAINPPCPRCNSSAAVSVRAENEKKDDPAEPDRVTKKTIVYVCGCGCVFSKTEHFDNPP